MSFRKPPRDPAYGAARVRHYTWEQVADYAGARGNSYATNHALSAQDCIAVLASLSAAATAFGALVDPQLHTSIARFQAAAAPFTVASSRLQHNRQAVADMSTNLNSLVLTLQSMAPDRATAMDWWFSIFHLVEAALSTIEQRYTMQFAHNLAALLAQAQVVQVQTSAGPLQLGTLSAPAIGPNAPNATPLASTAPPGSAASQVLQGAAQGAAVGAVAGPYGAVAGGLVGAALSQPGQAAIGGAAQAAGGALGITK